MLAEFENHDSLKEILKFKLVVISVFVITINQVRLIQISILGNLIYETILFIFEIHQI